MPVPYRAVVEANTVSSNGSLTYRIEDYDGAIVQASSQVRLPDGTPNKWVRKFLQEKVWDLQSADQSLAVGAECAETHSLPPATTTRPGVAQFATDNEATASKSCKSDDPRLSNDRTANNLRTATTQVSISGASAPSAGQVLTATGPTGASWATPAGGSNPPYYGNLAAAYGDGNPAVLLYAIQRGGIVAPTPTNIGTSIARCSFFRLPFALTVNKIRFYGIGATTNVYRMAIYRYSDRVRLTSELPVTTAAATWGSAGAGLNLTLAAGTLYFLAVAVNATGTTAGIASMGTTLAAGTGQVNTAPQSLPGNLDADAGFLNGYQCQFAVTGGALPATAPALAAQAAWSGGMPACWLDANNA